MAKELSTLLPLMNVPRCPQPLILQALRASCRRFCRDTEVWRETLADFDTVEDQASYDLSLVYDDAVLIRVREVAVDGVVLDDSDWAVSTNAELTFETAPNKSGKSVSVYVVLQPTTLCREVSDELIDRWGEAIAAGAMVDLKTDKGSEIDPVPWYDPASASVWMARYSDGVGEAKAEIYTEMQSGDKRVPVPVW